MGRTGTQSSRATDSLIQGFFQLYPEEAARQLNNLPDKEILRFLESDTIPIAVQIFLCLNSDTAARLVDRMDDDFFCRLFTDMDPARGAALLARLEESTIEKRLGLLPPALAKEYQELMSYTPQSAGALMDPRVTAFREDETVEEALASVRTFSDRRILDVCLVDQEGCLIGVVPLQELFLAQPTLRLGELSEGPPMSIQVTAPLEEVAQLLEEHRLASLPVVDLDEKLLGIIRHNELVRAAKQDAIQDVQAMFGAGRDERALSKASFAVHKRLPWLEINLATAFLAATVVGLFEETIARITVLAIFLPVVAGQSGNTGSQALAVTMRGLALREIRRRHWLKIVRKETAVGLFNGCVVALTTSLVVYLWMGVSGLALVIGVAMIFSMVVAGVSGALIPILLKTFGQDPAQSSSIILTTVTDVVGFMSFLGLATLLSDILGLT